MSAFAPTPSLARRLAASVARGTRAVANAVAWYVRAYLNRRVAIGMMDFDDRMLRDIGLTRGDVHASIVGPIDSDPTVRLRILAVERRAASRATARERLAIERELADKLAATERGLREAC